MSTTASRAWFIDSYDDTIIEIFEFSHGLSYNQRTSGNICDSPTGGTLVTTTSLPSDFLSYSGSVSRLSDRLVLVLEEETPSRLGDDPDLLNFTVGSSSSPIKSYITKFEFKNVETIGTTDGNPGQSLSASGSQILLPTLGTPIVFIGELDKERWERVSSFSMSGPEDKVFTYSASTGTVTFGDGVNGAIPEEEKDVILLITIRNGGGKWEYGGIVLEKGITNIREVKSVRDKIIYGQTPIGMMEFSNIPTVHSEINGFEQSIVSAEFGNTLVTYREWSFDYGGTVTVTGGGVTSINTNPSFQTYSVNLIGVDGPGAGQRHTNHIPAPGDTVHPLLNQLHTTWSVDGGSSITAVANPGVMEPNYLSFVVNSDDAQITGVSVLPIFYVFEIQNFGTISLKAGKTPGSCDPGDYHFVAAPSYEIFWCVWNGPLFTESRAHHGWNPDTLTHTGFEDLSDDDAPGGNFGIVSGAGFDVATGTPVSTGRTARMIAVGDKTGDFDNPVHTLADIGTGNFTIYPSECSSVGSGSFHKLVGGNSDRHTDWVTMTYEIRTLDSAQNAYETSILGSVVPNHQTIFTATPNLTVLEPAKSHICNALIDPEDPPLRQFPRGGTLNMLGPLVCT